MMSPSLNKHLEPVFEILLPELEKAGIEYWVYGGVSIAAFAEKFIRENKDVDIFVKETEFESTRSILDNLCNQNNFRLISCKPLRRTQRPKLEIKIDKRERLSVVPVYLKDNMVEFRFEKGLEKYRCQILEKVERNISGYRFFTPPNEYIKSVFKNYLTSRPDKKNKPKIQTDAKAILTPNELDQFYPPSRRVR